MLLKSPQFINPFMVRNLPTKGIVTDNAVQVAGESLGFVDGSYPDNTEVMVYMGRQFYCKSLAEIETERQEQKRQQDQRQLEAEQAQVKQIANAKVFNASLNVPVQWRPEIKPVLSGLLFNSMGNGEYKNSVVHIYLLEDLTDGRLSRKNNQYLCSQPEGNLDVVNWFDDTYTAKVTCKKCLEITKRWNGE